MPGSAGILPAGLRLAGWKPALPGDRPKLRNVSYIVNVNPCNQILTPDTETLLNYGNSTKLTIAPHSPYCPNQYACYMF